MHGGNAVTFGIFAILSVFASSYGFRASSHSAIQNWQGAQARKIGTGSARLRMAKDDAVSRRRKRRGKDTTISSPDSADTDASRERVVITPDTYTPEDSVTPDRGDGSSSLEDTFGLGNNQLRELMEQELPVPREDLVTKKEVKEVDNNKVFKLPELKEFLDSESEDRAEKEKRNEKDEMKKIDRSNQEEYLRVIQLNPFADADDSMFLEEVSRGVKCCTHCACVLLRVCMLENILYGVQQSILLE
jgi:hypothetical protein